MGTTRTRGKTPEPAPAAVVTTTTCRGGCGVTVKVLDVFCPDCLGRVPDELRERHARTRRSACITDRLAVEDELRRWLLAHGLVVDRAVPRFASAPDPRRWGPGMADSWGDERG